MSTDYDVIVLGGGSPGEHCAGALAEGGLRVALVERELVGGECSYWACIPSKTLLRPGEAGHVVPATGADPITPPIPGLRELDGTWTNREATGMKAVPRRLLVLGGGPVGVEMAQAAGRLGGEGALVEGAGHLLAREPAPLGEALAEVLRRDGIELLLGVQVAAARREGEDYVLEF